MTVLGDLESYQPNAEFIAYVEANPGAAGPSYRADIRMIDVTADAGLAVLVETDYLATDFSVARIDGRWWITNKTCGYTGTTR